MIAGEVERIQKTARAIAKLDAYLSMALVASRNQYVRPKINTRGIIDIKDGRHPVVEKMITNDMFIPNDTYLDNGKNRISVITGPNMAGKSTYMRQTALIVLMAQIGFFCACQQGKYRHSGPDLYQSRGLRRPGQRPEYLYGRDDRGGQYPAERYCPKVC